MKDGMHAPGRGKAELVGNIRYLADYREGTKAPPVEFSFGSASDDVVSFKPNSVPDLEGINRLFAVVEPLHISCCLS